MRERILSLLRQSGEISGQALSEQLAISRAAVGKHIKALRELGYQIEATTHVGYRFISAPDKLYPSEIRQYLPPDSPWELLWQEQVDSTNNYLRQIATDGGRNFSALLAETQTAGRGRLGRTWYAPPGSGIWMSILLRPPLPPEQAQLFTLVSAVAVTEALRELGHPVEIKWPNDLLLHGKKVCGILAEMQADPDTLHWIIVGIGINCYDQEWPEELRKSAAALGATAPRAQITAQILQSIEKYYGILCRDGFAPIRRRWLENSNCLNRPVVARTMRGKFQGVARDIDEQGYLHLELADGTIQRIVTGDIALG